LSVEDVLRSSVLYKVLLGSLLHVHNIIGLQLELLFDLPIKVSLIIKQLLKGKLIDGLFTFCSEGVLLNHCYVSRFTSVWCGPYHLNLFQESTEIILILAMISLLHEVFNLLLLRLVNVIFAVHGFKEIL